MRLFGIGGLGLIIMVWTSTDSVTEWSSVYIMDESGQMLVIKLSRAAFTMQRSLLSEFVVTAENLNTVLIQESLISLMGKGKQKRPGHSTIMLQFYHIKRYLPMKY